MITLSTHVLDTSTGNPAAGVMVRLERARSAFGTDALIAEARTDADGRARGLAPAAMPLDPGTYRLVFEIDAYFAARGIESFYPEVVVCFHIREQRHYHVPLLVSPFGFTSYRGS